MSYKRNMTKVISCIQVSFLLLCLLTQVAYAQQKQGQIREIRTTPVTSSVYAPLPQGTASIATDTLRNFFKGDTVFRWPASALFTDATGWIHGTNSFEDISKATRITLPGNASTALLEEVHITFIHKANTVTNENYSIEIYGVDSDGSPGTLLGTQTYSYQFVDADEDLGTPAFTTLHILDSPVPVSSQFFISINLGPYNSSGYSNIDIASTDLQGVAISEDWEQLNDGSWANMSDSWFSAGDNGWLMWMEAVVDIQAQGGAPVITHTAPAAVPEDMPFTVTADIQSPTGVATAAIGYLQGGNSLDQVILQLMTNTGGNTWQGTIPADFINTAGFSYAIAAADNSGESSNTLDFSPTVSTAGLSRNLGFNGGDASDYRLFSMPIDLSNKSPASILEDDLGSYDPENWRLFSLNADQSYAEFPSAEQMRPGVGFWLATRDVASITTGPGGTSSLAVPFIIQLDPGWTFIGTPFNYAVPQDQLVVVSGEALDIRTFNGSWSTLNGTLQPFAGYAVASTSASQLLVSPFPPDTGKREATHAASVFDWSISITASSNQVIDNDNVAAVSQDASHKWDVHDRPEPPVIGDYVSVYFPHDDWGVPFKRFNTDVQPAQTGFNRWTFEISSNVSGHIDLSFDGISDIPSSRQVILFDKLMREEIDLRTTPFYRVKGSTQPFEERFELVVGNDGALDALRSEVLAVPATLSLESFPNPFQERSTIRLSLDEKATFSLSVYNSLGQRVASLAEQETRDAGVHHFEWTAADLDQQALASGLYFFVLETPTKRLTQKAVMLR